MFRSGSGRPPARKLAEAPARRDRGGQRSAMQGPAPGRARRSATLSAGSPPRPCASPGRSLRTAAACSSPAVANGGCGRQCSPWRPTGACPPPGPTPTPTTPTVGRLCCQAGVRIHAPCPWTGTADFSPTGQARCGSPLRGTRSRSLPGRSRCVRLWTARSPHSTRQDIRRPRCPYGGPDRSATSRSSVASSWSATPSAAMAGARPASQMALTGWPASGS